MLSSLLQGPAFSTNSLCSGAPPKQLTRTSYYHSFAARSENRITSSTVNRDHPENFPQLFQGLGTLAGEYQFQLRPDEKPHSIFTPRHVPLPLRPKAVEDLDRMEKSGMISKVTDPTPWCTRMVVVSKKSGKI